MKKWLARQGRSLRRRSTSDLLRRFYAIVFALFLLAFGWGLYRAVSYAYRAPGLQIGSIAVQGLDRVSEGEVLSRTDITSGTSILGLDLEQMRESIEGLRWVKHASVQRVWPREIVIAVTERDPIAIARIDGQIFQVDEDGVVLPVDGGSLDDAPILDGLRLDDMEGNRARIGIYRDTVQLIGEGLLSEVHISDAGEVSVVPINHPILVDLGLDRHQERWARYVEHGARIRREYPGVSRVDLRFEGQVIIRLGDDQPARNLIWDEETRLL
jgi:cell division protein FtsQ